MEKTPSFKKARDKAKLMLELTKEAEVVEKRLKVKAVIVIAMLEENGQIFIQDAGRFPMPPQQLYQLLIQAHTPQPSPPSSKLIKPN